MKITKIPKMSETPKTPAPSRPDQKMFTSLDMRDADLVSDSKDFCVGIVHYGKGVRNKWHTHDSDQLLIVTDGEGFMATEKEERVIKTGDFVFSPAGEKHRHGGSKNSAISHVFVTRKGSICTQLED